MCLWSNMYEHQENDLGDLRGKVGGTHYRPCVGSSQKYWSKREQICNLLSILSVTPHQSEFAATVLSSGVIIPVCNTLLLIVFDNSEAGTNWGVR